MGRIEDSKRSRAERPRRISRRATVYWVIVTFLPILGGCTGNPFGQDEISIGRRQISGRVVLSDGSSPKGVYVWLQGYDLTTQTDENGDFQVLLPLQPKQEGVSGQIEQDTLYFYLANYLLETAAVMIVKGEFLYSRAAVDKDGNAGTMEMRRFLRIITDVEPSVVQSNFSELIAVRTTLQAETNCATVGIPKIPGVDRQSDEGPLGAILLRKLSTDEIQIVEAYPDEEGSAVVRVCSNPFFTTLRFDATTVQLSAGEYEVIPYLWVNPEGVPARLLEIASLPFNGLDANYLNKPMRREGGRFEVRN